MGLKLEIHTTMAMSVLIHTSTWHLQKIHSQHQQVYQQQQDNI